MQMNTNVRHSIESSYLQLECFSKQVVFTQFDNEAYNWKIHWQGFLQGKLWLKRLRLYFFDRSPPGGSPYNGLYGRLRPNGVLFQASGI